MKAFIKTATRFNLAAPIAAAFLAIAVPAQADPKAIPGPAADPLKEKKAKLELQKERIVAMRQKKEDNHSQKQTVDKNSSKKSTVTASPSATPPKTKKSLSNDD
jgi:hypothetical protein